MMNESVGSRLSGFGLQGSRALVTGGSTGIGRAIALGLAHCGSRLLLQYRRSVDEAENVVAQIRRMGGEAFALPADLREPAAPGRMVDQAAAAFGGLDILVNNAGALGRRLPIDELSDEELVEVTTLNYFAVVRTCRQAMPLLADGGGSVINLSSVAAKSGGAGGTSAYCGAKAAVEGFTRALAKEGAQRSVRANVLAPGVIETPFHTDTAPELLARMQEQIPLGRLGAADDCVGAALLLASPTFGSFITGQVLEVNGGQRIG